MDKKSIIKTNVTDASQEEIQARICTIRGEQVMLDRDLSMFYGVETRRINEQVKRNKSRFPEDFCFQLTKDEWESLRPRNATINKTEILISQNATSNRGGVRKLPYAFTEPGVVTSCYFRAVVRYRMRMGCVLVCVRSGQECRSQDCAD